MTPRDFASIHFSLIHHSLFTIPPCPPITTCTRRCAATPPASRRQYAAQALAVGLSEIGFSDHSPMRQDDFDNWRMRLDQLGEYVEKVRQAQKDHPALQIKLALEVDYLPGHEDWIRDLAARYPWDYFIGSVHYVSDSGRWTTRSIFPAGRRRMRSRFGRFILIG